jgi:hypothetical protein
MAFRMNRLPDGFTDEIANGGFWRKAAPDSASTDGLRLPSLPKAALISTAGQSALPPQ